MAVANQEEEGEQQWATTEELFCAQEGPLLAYALRITGDVQVAEDLVQEAFMKLHPQFDTVRHPRSWLYRTVHNMALNHLRGGRKIVRIEWNAEAPGGIDPIDPELLPDARLQRMEAIGQARICLESLDERSRELIRLKFEEGLSYKEISGRTGLSVSNVGYVLHHAIRSMAANLENSGFQL